MDFLRAAARGRADPAVLKRCLAQAPPEQSMYVVLLHHHRGTGNLRVRSVLPAHTFCKVSATQITGSHATVPCVANMLMFEGLAGVACAGNVHGKYCPR